MEYFVQQLINGLALGSIYGLIAIGYTMVYGIIGMINFAHGDIFMVGAFLALIGLILVGVTSATPILLLLAALLVVLVGAMAFTAVWGWTVERLAYRPLRGSFRLAPLITAIGVSIVLQNFVQLTQGAPAQAAAADHRRQPRAPRARWIYRSDLQHPDHDDRTDYRAHGGVLADHLPHVPRPGHRACEQDRGWRRCSASMSTGRSR